MNQVEEILEEHILHVLKKQKAKKRHIPIDLVMLNGNILLSQFRLYEYDKKSKQIKGLTHREEYSHPREEREPVYCYLYLKEISNLYCPDLGIDYPAGFEIHIAHLNPMASRL